MKRFSLRNAAALLLAGFVLSGCGGDDSSFDKEQFKIIAEKYKMKERDQVAFQVCVEKSDAKTPYVKMGSDVMVMASVPMEVCGCQTSTIVSVFKEKKLGSYGKFMKWVGEPVRRGAPNFQKADFAYEAKPKNIGDKLALALESCTRQYIAANEKPGKKLLKLYVDKAQKKKDAEAKAAAEKKKAEG